MFHNFVNKFATSDWHLYHDNILKFTKRPFKDVDEMAQTYVKKYNSRVGPHDLCFFLGDMGNKNKEGIREIITSLNGTKVLILGNHDSFGYNVGFDLVLNAAVLYIGKKRVSMSHCPLRGKYREDISGMGHAVAGDGWYGESRPKNAQFVIGDYDADYHLHGHCHAPNNGRSKRIEGNQIDVGVDANDGYPVSFKTINNWFDEIERGTCLT